MRPVGFEDVYLRDYQTPAEARIGLERYFAYYNHLRCHRSLGRRTPGLVYGLEMSAADKKLLAEPVATSIIKTGVGCSVAAHAAVAPASLRSASATAAGTLTVTIVPPYSRPDTVQRTGTS